MVLEISPLPELWIAPSHVHDGVDDAARANLPVEQQVEHELLLGSRPGEERAVDVEDGGDHEARISARAS